MTSLRYLAPLSLWLAISVVTTLIEGTPDRLPAVALGSAVLLHAIRAAALFAIGFGLATVLTRAGAGRLPTELSTSGIAYDPAELAGETTDELQGQVDELIATVSELAARLDAADPNA